MSSYREYVYALCEGTDFNDPEDATRTVQLLAKELIRHSDACLEYEKKLEEIMTAKEWREFISATSRKLFKQEIDGMADSEFKDFIIERFDEITEADA